MKGLCRSFAAVLASVISVSSAALAQAPGQSPPAAASTVTAVFLEKRVPEELATEGVVLSRQNLALKVEQVGAIWVVSLLDLNTSHAVASTKVDGLSLDREAAVAAMTHVVAELASQLAVRAPAGAAEPSATALPADLAAVADREKVEREAHEAAELSYQRHAIHFGKTLSITGGHTVSVESSWEIYQGELDQPMAAVDFYNAVDRPDLYASYQRRRATGLVIEIVGLAALAAGIGIVVDAGHDETKAGIGIGVGMVGALGLLIGGRFRIHAHPIEESEAKALADKYNQGLRRDLGLPVVSQREPVLRDVRLVPFTGASGGGLALGGQF